MSENGGSGFPELESGEVEPLVSRQASNVSSTSKKSPIDKDPTAQFRFLISVFGILVLGFCMYLWNESMAQSLDVSSVELKSGQATRTKRPVVTTAPIQSPPEGAPSMGPKESTEPETPSENQKTDAPAEPPSDAPVDPPPTDAPVEAAKKTDPPVPETTAPPVDSPAETVSEAKTAPIESDGTCDALCDKRQEARISKFGGDFLNITDVVRLAKQAREETIASLRETYGTYFDSIFVDDESEKKRFRGIKEIGDKSTYRLRRKLKLKVLRTMQEVHQKESNVLGCDCVQRQGKATGTPEESAESIPDFYGKYVFANGGHSSAAGHGNPYNQSYTAVLTDDLKPIFKAIGIDFIGRNYAAGGMPASPIVSTCSKEIFGMDIDFLTWNYGMTDKSDPSIVYYMYRAAILPNHPAFMLIDPSHKQKTCLALAKEGLSFFETNINPKGIPDSAPDGIPLTGKELEAIPPALQYFKEDGAIDTGAHKFICSRALRNAGSDCKCMGLPGQTGWHPGYKSHALQGRHIALPFIDILSDALEEIAQSQKDVATLLAELEEEENADFENFISQPVIEPKPAFFDGTFWKALDSDLMETWFKGPSICRTGYLPSESRFLGITTNSDKTGSVARCGEETFDIGTIISRAPYPDFNYTYVRGNELVPGEFNIVGWEGARYCVDVEECPEIVSPDSSDWLYGDLKDGKTSLTLPNEKEKEYYSYDGEKFKGIIAFIATVWPESYKKRTPPADFSFEQLQNYSKTTVNGKPVAKWREFAAMAILEDENGSVFWPANENGQYVIEFEPFGFIESIDRFAADQHIRFAGVVLY